MFTPTMLKKMPKNTRKVTTSASSFSDLSNELMSRFSPGMALMLLKGLKTLSERKYLSRGMFGRYSTQL